MKKEKVHSLYAVGSSRVWAHYGSVETDRNTNFAGFFNFNFIFTSKKSMKLLQINYIQ